MGISQSTHGLECGCCGSLTDDLKVGDQLWLPFTEPYAASRGTELSKVSKNAKWQYCVFDHCRIDLLFP